MNLIIKTHQWKAKAIFILFLINSFSIFGQQVSITSNPSTSGSVPFGTSNYGAIEAIYTATELANNFGAANLAINTISFNCYSIPYVNTTFSNVNIYLKEVDNSITTFASGTYTTAGYTLVFSGAVPVTSTGWKQINLTTPFVRQDVNKNLQLLVERTDGLLHTSSIFITSNGNHAGSLPSSCRRYNNTSALSASTSLTASALRPAIIFEHRFSNDATIQQIYTLGKMAIPHANPHIIKANIANLGTATMSNIIATLNVTGANTFTSTQSIASLASGANTTVPFSGFSPTNFGTDTVKVTLSSDDNNGNNNSSMLQTVTYDINDYTYNGISAAGGFGFNNTTGDFAAKYYTSLPIKIDHIKVTFSNVSIQPFKVAVWEASGSGTPGNLLWESPLQSSSMGTFTIPTYSNVGINANKSYFVGIRQLGSTNLGFSGQAENPIRTNSFYYASPTGNTTWVDFSTNNIAFRPMIEVKTGFPLEVLLNAKVYLNHVNSANGLMDNFISTLSSFPLSDPYSTAPLSSAFIKVGNNAIETMDASALSITGNDAIVDWLFIELRQGTTGNTSVVYTKAALLQRDGDIVGMDGINPVGFYVPDGNYYIAVRHRSHLGFRTANTYALSGTPTVLNLTNNSVPLFGATPIFNMTSNIAVMNGSDANFDGSIDAFDTITWEQQNGLFNNYSYNADYNLDGSVDAFDSIIWELNNGKFQELD